VRRSALDLRLDGLERRDARRSRNSVCPAYVDSDAAARRCNGGMELVRLELSRGGEQSRRNAAGAELSGNALVAGQRIRPAPRRQIAADAYGTRAADESDADNGGCETFRDEQQGQVDLTVCGMRLPGPNDRASLRSALTTGVRHQSRCDTVITADSGTSREECRCGE
jgi:hypothetical protein